ncbi:MAG: PTS sugar transporter subunit IIA [Sarcina sp.]
MFEIFKKELKLFSIIDGKTLDLTNVPDPIFAQKMAGDGIAIDPNGDTVLAPADGEINLIFKTNHAFAMTLDNGLELLIHIGIDTVSLNGEGFERLVSSGEYVKMGTPIIKFDKSLLLSKGFSLITPVLITNPDSIKIIKPLINKDVKAGFDPIILYK